MTIAMVVVMLNNTIEYTDGHEDRDDDYDSLTMTTTCL